MSDNYKWYPIPCMIDCNSFKACYQVCRQLKRHGFEKTYEMTMGNTRIISYIKNETDITLYIYNKLTEPLTHRKITYIDYISKLSDRYTRHYRKDEKHV